MHRKTLKVKVGNEISLFEWHLGKSGFLDSKSW